MSLRGLYAITDTPLLAGGKLLPYAEAALKGGASLLQYRDKGDDAAIIENIEVSLSLSELRPWKLKPVPMASSMCSNGFGSCCSWVELISPTSRLRCRGPS